MHARRASLALTIADAVRRLMLLVCAFGLALAMGALATQGPGPRTVDFSFPDDQVQTGPTSAHATPDR